MSEDMCPYVTLHNVCATLKGCGRSVWKAANSTYIYPCPETCYKGDYKQCPMYNR